MIGILSSDVLVMVLDLARIFVFLLLAGMGISEFTWNVQIAGPHSMTGPSFIHMENQTLIHTVSASKPTSIVISGDCYLPV